MLTAPQFWTPERREALKAHRANPCIGGGWRPDKLCRFKCGQSENVITSGPHEGFWLHSKWPDGLNYMRSCRKGDKEAMRILNHQGWYTDSFMDGVIYACAVEVRVPRRRAKREGVEHDDRGQGEGCTRVRWVAATEHSDWDQICIDRNNLHDTLRDAILEADSVAKRSAEIDREADAKDQAEQRIVDLQQEIEDSQADIARFRAELGLLCEQHVVARQALKERIQQEDQAIAKAQRRIDELEADFWKAVA